MKTNNERNAGRKPKYKEETVILPQRKVPKSQLDACVELLDNHLKPFLYGAPDAAPTTLPSNETEKTCGCYMDGKIMKRGKEKPACKLTREQHNF